MAVFEITLTINHGRPENVLRRNFTAFDRSTTLIVWLVVAFAYALPTNAQTTKKITFDDHLRPIFQRRCSTCHNSDRREGDLDVTSFVNLMQGGGSGTVLAPRDPSGSYLYELVTYAGSPEMPPGGNKIPDAEIKLIADWINGGLLENSGSKAAKRNSNVDLLLKTSPTKRPEILPTPFRISLAPAITTPVGSVFAIASNPWAPVIAVSTPRQILLYRSDRLELAGILPNETGIAQSLRFSRNGKLLLAGGGRGGESGSVLIFDARSGERLSRLGEERDTILAADLSADQSLIVTGSPGKRVRVVSSGGEPVHEFKRHTDWVTAVGFSPDGKFLATADRDGGLLLWEPKSGLFVQKYEGHSQAITSLQWRGDSRFLVTAGEDGNVRIWDTQKIKPVKSWAAHDQGALVAGFRRDGSVYSAGRDQLVKLWQADGKLIRDFKGLQDIAVAATVCDETDRIFAADWSGMLLVWNLDDGKKLKHLSANPPTLVEALARAKSEFKQAQIKYVDEAAIQKRLQAEISQAEDQQLSGLKAKLKKQSETAAAAKQYLTSKRKSVTRWQEEILFDQSLKRFRNQLSHSKQLLRDKSQTAQQVQQSQKTIETIQKKLRQLQEAE